MMQMFGGKKKKIRTEQEMSTISTWSWNNKKPRTEEWEENKMM